jgi:hypothetical protein
MRGRSHRKLKELPLDSAGLIADLTNRHTVDRVAKLGDEIESRTNGSTRSGEIRERWRDRFQLLVPGVVAPANVPRPRAEVAHQVCDVSCSVEGTGHPHKERVEVIADGVPGRLLARCKTGNHDLIACTHDTVEAQRHGPRDVLETVADVAPETCEPPALVRRIEQALSRY